MTAIRNDVRTEAIYAYMHLNAEEVKVCPTIRQVADTFGIAVSTAHHHVEKLMDQGRLVADRNKGIRLP